MSPQVRSEQASAMGGCATCQPAAPAPASQSAASNSSVPPKSVVVVDPKKDTWIGIELVDAQKRPVPNEAFVVTPANHDPINGTLDSNGKARIEGVDPGTCTVEFPRLDKREFV